MNRQILRTGLAVLAFALCSSTAFAQATRTWVSGVGDDANPCSRTAPCKTFPGAISKTAARGEINAIDSGGFGGVTITKSITIDGGAVLAGVLTTGTNGIVINAGVNDVVTLKNLQINGGGNGLIGIKILQAGTVVIENCEIWNYNSAAPNGRGISDERTAGKLDIIDSVIRNNGRSGIVISAVQASLNRIRVLNNANGGGVVATGGAKVVVRDSVATGNSTAFSADTANTRMSLISSSVSANGGGVRASSGAMIFISDNTVFNNDVGVLESGGTILTYGDNQIDGNTTDGTTSGTLNER